MSRSSGASRWRAGWVVGLAVCGLAATPGLAVPSAPARAVVAGPLVTGWVIGGSRRPKATSLTVFVAQPVGLSAVRLLVETCSGDECIYDDRILPGTVQWSGSSVMLRVVDHPVLGSVALEGTATQPVPGTSSWCYMTWEGRIAEMVTTAADYSRVTWTGRIGTYTVRSLPGEPCSYSHQAGVLLVS